MGPGGPGTLRGSTKRTCKDPYAGATDPCGEINEVGRMNECREHGVLRRSSDLCPEIFAVQPGDVFHGDLFRALCFAGIRV